ncbi:MAG: hypothetical protein ABI321_24445 [Polyangia bacterium]
MTLRPSSRCTRTLVALLAVSLGSARADDNDLTLETLIGHPALPGTAPTITTATRSRYVGLVSQLGVALAPRLVQPADSLGWSGFAVDFDASATQIDRDADYWQRGVQRVRGAYLSVIGATVRKGLWLGAPQLEMSFGGHHLSNSRMYTLELGAKLALHEGFCGWHVPSIAARVAVAQLFGSPELGLTVLDAGLVVSKRFAIAGTLQLDPYLGADLLVIFARSRVIDTTPEVDAYEQQPNAVDESANVTLPNPGNLPRVRVQAGMRMRLSLFAVTVEAAYALCNGTGRSCDRGGDSHVVDRSRGQLQINLGAGLVY